MNRRLGVKELQAASGTTLTANNLLIPSSIVQVKYVRMDTATAYTAVANQIGTKVPELDISVAPYSADSTIFLSYMLHVEGSEDTVFLVVENNESPFGETEYWFGLATITYDKDNSSTPNNHKFMIGLPARNTNYRTYSLTTKASNGSSNSIAFNRPQGSWGQAAWENGISTVVLMELTP